MFGGSFSYSGVVVVAAGFLVNAFTMGEFKSIGPFFIQLQNEFDANAQQSSLFMSLLYGAYFACGPFASALSNRLGFRTTMLLGGLIAGGGAVICSLAKSLVTVYVSSIMIGIGCGFNTVPAFAIIGLTFKDKRPLANNVMTMGSALMAIPLSPVVQLWIDAYSWRGAVLLLGGLFLNTMPSGLLMTQHSRTGIKRQWKLSEMKILKTFSFFSYMVCSGADLAAMVCVSVYLVRFSQSKGVDDYLAASLSSILSVVDLCLRPISGYATSLSNVGRIPIVRPYVFAAIAVIQACVVMSFAFCSDIYGIAAVSVAYAICIGCRGALSVTLVTEFFGTTNIVTALGLRALSLGLFSAAAPPIVGRIADATGSYNSPFFASAFLSLVSAISVLVAKKTAPPNIATEQKQIKQDDFEVDRDVASVSHRSKEEDERIRIDNFTH